VSFAESDVLSYGRNAAKIIEIYLLFGFCNLEFILTFELYILYIKGLHIAEYQYGNIENHEPQRTRKLLLQKKEIKKIRKYVTERGYTLIPISLFINERGLVKVEIALAQGKKLHDKRKDIKDKDMKRDMDRMKF
jgi:SsrA-binding protein